MFDFGRHIRPQSPPPQHRHGHHRCRMFQEEVVATSLEKRCTAADEKASLDMDQELLMLSPPVMAYVPDRWPDGRTKDVCGWQVAVVWSRIRRVAPSVVRPAMQLPCLLALLDCFFDGKIIDLRAEERLEIYPGILCTWYVFLATISDRLCIDVCDRGQKCVVNETTRFLVTYPGRFAADESTLRR